MSTVNLDLPLPAWAKWWAVDYNGDRKCFANKPVQDVSNQQWITRDSNDKLVDVFAYGAAFQIDWDITLKRVPNQPNNNSEVGDE